MYNHENVGPGMRKRMINMIYFTSDLHLGHSSIIKMKNRPFNDVNEMNRTLIRNYNNCVKNNDICYILGDICHHLRSEETNEIIKKLNGKKILIKGNHDKEFDKTLFDGVYDLFSTSISIGNYNRYFVMMHYPMLSWNKANTGSIHIHGHIHSDGNYNAENRNKHILRYDVGVDANNYYPVSALQLFDYFKDALNTSIEIDQLEEELTQSSY